MPIHLSSLSLTLMIDGTSKLEMYKNGSNAFVNLFRRSALGTWRLANTVKIAGDRIITWRSLDGLPVELRAQPEEETVHVTRVPL